jgi:hypothetical protein
MDPTHPVTIGAALGQWEILLIAVSILCLAFWIWMIVDCAMHEASTGSKVAWLSVIIFGSLIGAPLYYFVRKIPRYYAAKPK